jgi:hypothetical protein
MFIYFFSPSSYFVITVGSIPVGTIFGLCLHQKRLITNGKKSEPQICADLNDYADEEQKARILPFPPFLKSKMGETQRGCFGWRV